MFLYKNNLDENLKCPVCEKRFEIPKQLPCGETICSNCELNLLKKDEHCFECSVCKEIHFKTLNGLPLNKCIQRLLSYEPIDIYRGEVYKNGKEQLNVMNAEINGFQNKIEKSEVFIRHHCESMRNEIDVITESNIAQLNLYRDQLMKQINEFEIECLENIKDTNKDFILFKNFVEDSKVKYDNWAKYLNGIDLNDMEISRIINETREMNGFIKDKNVSFDDFMFCNKKLIFEKNDSNKIESKHIGSLVYKKLMKLADVEKNVISQEQFIPNSPKLTRNLSFFDFSNFRNE